MVFVQGVPVAGDGDEWWWWVSKFFKCGCLWWELVQVVYCDCLFNVGRWWWVLSSLAVIDDIDGEGVAGDRITGLLVVVVSEWCSISCHCLWFM